MHRLCFVVLLALLLACCKDVQEPFVDLPTVNFTNSKSFRERNNDSGLNIWYGYAGLGANFGSMQAVLEVTGNEYVLTKQQNSFYTERSKEKIFLSNGLIRWSSLDSILGLVAFMKDTTIFDFNPHISSGGMQYLTIRTPSIDVEFELHNMYNPIAARIVDILNSNLPADQRILWIFPEEKNAENQK